MSDYNIKVGDKIKSRYGLWWIKVLETTPKFILCTLYRVPDGDEEWYTMKKKVLYHEDTYEYYIRLPRELNSIFSWEPKREFRPQTRIGECAGCKGVCEECERLVIHSHNIMI